MSRCQAEEKLIELAEIRRAYEGETELAAKNRSLLDARATSALIHRAGIKSRSEKIGESDIKRRSPYSQRIGLIISGGRLMHFAWQRRG